MPRGELFLGFTQEAVNDFNRRVNEANARIEAEEESVTQEPQSQEAFVTISTTGTSA